MLSQSVPQRPKSGALQGVPCSASLSPGVAALVPGAEVGSGVTLEWSLFPVSAASRGPALLRSDRACDMGSAPSASGCVRVPSFPRPFPGGAEANQPSAPPPALLARWRRSRAGWGAWVRRSLACGRPLRPGCARSRGRWFPATYPSVPAVAALPSTPAVGQGAAPVPPDSGREPPFSFMCVTSLLSQQRSLIFVIIVLRLICCSFLNP